MSKRMRTSARLLAVGLLAVLLTGCIKLNVDLNVSSDNKVSGTMVFAFSKQLLQLTGQSAQDVIGSSAPLPSNVAGVTSKPYDDGQFAGQEITFSDVPLDQLNSSDPTSLHIVREGDVFSVSGVLDLSSDQTTGSANVPGLQDALSSADIRISLTFPGAVSDSNGEIDGNTVTWRPKIGDRLEFQAQASAIESGSGVTTILLFGGIGLVVLIVIVALVMTMRRRAHVEAEAVPAMAGAPADAGSMGGVPAPPPPVMGAPAPPAPPAPTMPPPPAPTTEAMPPSDVPPQP